MARGLLYVPLDVDYADDQKVGEAGEKAELLYVRALCTAKKMLSDGFVADIQINRYGLPGWQQRARRLVEVGLWRRDAEHAGYWILGWLKHNAPADEVHGKSTAKREAASKANHKRWHVDRGEVEPACPYCQSGSQVGSQNGSQSGSDQHRKADPTSESTEVEGSKDKTTPPLRPPPDGSTAAPPGDHGEGGQDEPQAAGRATPAALKAAFVAAVPPGIGQALQASRRWHGAAVKPLAALAERGWTGDDLADAATERAWGDADSAVGVALDRLRRCVDREPPAQRAVQDAAALAVQARRDAADQAELAERQKREHLRRVAYDALPPDTIAALEPIAAAHLGDAVRKPNGQPMLVPVRNTIGEWAAGLAPPPTGAGEILGLPPRRPRGKLQPVQWEPSA